MNIQLPLSLGELTSTLAGLAAWSFIVAQWTKNALPDWRWVNWITLGVVVLTSVLGRIILGGATAPDMMWSVLLAVMATSLETFGYEAISNGLGKIFGVGPRSDKALRVDARETLA